MKTNTLALYAVYDDNTRSEYTFMYGTRYYTVIRFFRFYINVQRRIMIILYNNTLMVWASVRIYRCGGGARGRYLYKVIRALKAILHFTCGLKKKKG